MIISNYSNSTPPFPFTIVRHLVRLRCQLFPYDQKIENRTKSEPVLWSYEGKLFDPQNGLTIANVEGIELVSLKSECFNSCCKSNNRKKDIGSCFCTKNTLENFSDNIKNMLYSSSSWDYATSIESRKLFCYCSKTSNSQPLSSIQRSTLNTLGRASNKQKMISYNTTTTYVSRDNGNELVLHVEWPKDCGGHWIISTADSSVGSCSGSDDWKGINWFKNDKLSLEFSTCIASNGNNSNDVPKLPPLISSKQSSVSSLPRSQFVQFGQTKKQNIYSYARESYSYSLGNFPVSTVCHANQGHPGSILRLIIRKLHHSLLFKKIYSSNVLPHTLSNCVLRYTRYGEAPPWYGLGRMAILELWGRPVRSVCDAPPFVASLASKIGAVSKSNADGLSSEERFNTPCEEHFFAMRDRLQFWQVEQACKKMWNLMQKIQLASTHVTLPVT